MSLVSLLSIARSALTAHQAAVDVTGHNIANSTTEGYSRQRVRLSADVPLMLPQGAVGRGVVIDGIERARDKLLDASFRQESGLLGQYTTLGDLLGQVEAVFGEPSETGLGATLDAFFSAFGDLANDPTSTTARSAVRTGAEQLARQFAAADDRIRTVANDAVARMRGAVDEVNRLATEIAEINRQIQESAGGQRSAPDLLDQRDRLVDELSGYLSVRVVEQPNGTINVVAGDGLLVDHAVSGRLEVRLTDDGTYTVGVHGSPSTLDAGSGTLKALSDLATRTLPGIQDRLDRLAAGIVAEVNAIHRQGMAPDGSTGADFFDPAGTTAASLAVAAPIRQSLAAIAAGRPGAGNVYQPGDGSIALGLAQLRTGAAASLGGVTISDFYAGVVSTVGVMTRDADQLAASQEVMVANARSRREAVSGVSVDEEMVNLIAHQQAYAAAAKLVTVADEMVQELLRMV